MNTSHSPSRLCRHAWLLAVFSSGAAFGIDPHRAVSQYVYQHWGTEEGLPRGSVNAITQTADGYLWIGAQAGLIRFDGLHFQLIRDQSGSLPFTDVIGLVSDNQGSLWLRLQDMTMLRYHNEQFDDPPSPAEAMWNITAVARTNRGGVLLVKRQLGAFTYGRDAMELLAAANGMPRSPVIAIAQGGDGSYWLGTRGAGLFRLQNGKTSPITQGLPDQKINCMLPDGPSGLWIGTDDGIIRWNGTSLTKEGIPNTLRGDQILSLIKDHDANLWVGTASGQLIRFNGSGVAALSPEMRDAGSAVTTLFEDRENNLWFGGANGLERLRDSPFVSYSLPEGLPTDGSNPIYVDAANRTWFAGSDGGLWWFDDNERGRVRADGLDKDIVYSIAGGGSELWVGRQRGGLTRLHFHGGAIKASTYGKRDGLAQNSVYSVYQARDGTVWVGTLSGGVSRWEKGRFTNYSIADGLASNTVSSILQSADGTMWFATPGGLSTLYKGRWRTLSVAAGLPSENVNCLLEDAAGVVWAGTTAGLAYYRAGAFHVPAPIPAPLQEPIFGIAEDKEGWLWLSTSNHVLRVNRRKLELGNLTDADIREYGLADGLRGVEGIKRHQSAVTDPLGRIWLSLNNGISVLDPARILTNRAPPIPHIEGVLADGDSLDLKGPMHVPAGRQRLLFAYAGASLSIPERVRFRYRLENFDRDWSRPVMEHEAAYTNLNPGPYRFRVIASNSDGIWSNEADIAFVVNPAYWQTVWFRAVVAVMAVLFAVGLYQLRLRRLTGRLTLRFEERLAERTRIAQELHDTLLQGFLSVSMQVHVVAERLPADSPLKPPLSRSLGLMRQVIDEGRNALRGLRSQQGVPVELEQAFSRIQHELTPAGQNSDAVHYRVIVEGIRRPLHPVLRDEVYRIGREAIINAFRHSKAENIEVELNYSANVFRLMVRDDGAGIDPKTVAEGREGHWGILGMRERAEQIGARLRLLSSAHRGTEVELSIPGHIAFQDASKTLRR